MIFLYIFQEIHIDGFFNLENLLSKELAFIMLRLEDTNTKRNTYIPRTSKSDEACIAHPRVQLFPDWNR